MINIKKISCLRYTLPIYATADIKDGALLMIGQTGGTDKGFLVKASDGGSGIPNAFATMAALYDYSELGSSASDGSAWVLRDVKPIFEDANVMEIDYDLTDTMALAGDESSKVITITSLEDNLDTGWLYCVSGTGIGQLRYIAASQSGQCTFKTAGSPEWLTGDTCIKILPFFHTVIKLNSDSLQIGTDAAAGTWKANVIANYIERSGQKEQLSPLVHDGLSGLNATSLRTRFLSHIIVKDTFWYPLS